MTAPTYPIPGVYTPSPTFFKNSGPNGRQEVDVEAQVQHTKFLADNGISGVVLLGSTGEMIHMTRKERIQLISGVRKGLDAEDKYKSFPILAGVAHHGVEDTLEEIKVMKEAGAVYAMVLAPNYFAPSQTQEGIISWFTAVADESVLPVVIYYFPGVSNNLRMTPKTFEILSAHTNIVGCKLSHGNVSEYAQIALNPVVEKNNFTTMTGLGQLLLPAMSVGVHGTIDAMSGIFPKTLVKLFTLAKEGKYAEAAKIQYVVSKVEEVVVAYGPVGIKHTVSKVLGIGANEVGRAPLNVAIPKAAQEAFAADIQAAAELEKSL
ncbi:hypothetical protein TRVA0_013S02234 [Trichomonascus vanleenenianus]|uniref:dihydrodipicolinate synthase family protein n=1 Tax=Trichomonascus vanleenenianus TaxID=2268995 RepID=UPI003ECA785B